MNRFLIVILCVILILIMGLMIFFLDFSYMNNPEKICGMKNIEDITQNDKSSFIINIVYCHNMTIKDEQQVEKEECNKQVEDFEWCCDKEEEGKDENVEVPQQPAKPETPNNSAETEAEISKTWGIEIGDKNGLTYYSQIDDRWKDNLYTVTGNKNQTIGSSGCGPAAIAMVVSSIKGTVTPDKIAEAFVKNGYRSPNNGTYWSAFRATAKEFDINYLETSNFEKVLDLLKNNYYVIVSCGNGLFTTGGHYVVLVGIDGNTLKIYDPYLYKGKFNIPIRRGKVVVEGNTVYCSVNNFKKYANYKSFFCYQDEI